MQTEQSDQTKSLGSSLKNLWKTRRQEQMKIRNMKDLEKALQPVMLGMVDELAERVYETLNYFLQE